MSTDVLFGRLEKEQENYEVLREQDACGNRAATNCYGDGLGRFFDRELQAAYCDKSDLEGRKIN